jgi:Carboxypeptidase regulatory-like domain/TonB dependent receptor/TonB-dependent Receptor Plug Domain
MNTLPVNNQFHRIAWILALAVLILFTSEGRTARAQDLDTVTISGRVTDQNKAVIPGATVTATLVKTAVARTVVTDGDGHYKLIQLEPGVYNLKASFTNFAAEEKTGLSTIAGQNIPLDFTLKPAGVTAEAVVVSAGETPLVDTTRTVVGGTVEAHEIESLPVNSRSPLDLIFTLGGVSEEPLSTRDLAEDRTTSRSTPEEAGNFSLSGGPAYSNNVTIDGLDNNDDRGARERFTPSIEAVEEVQIIRNQFAAEYGRASGGRINLRTRGGSNKYHGRFFYFFRDESLNANTWKNNKEGLSRLPLQQHDPGFTFSGPVFIPKIYRGRDRTFFFTAYEYDTLLDSTLIDALVPVDQNSLFPLPAPTNLAARRPENASTPALNAINGVAPFVSTISTPSRNHIFTTRVDHKFNDLHNGSFLFQLGRLNNLRQFGGGNRLADALLGKTRNTDAISYSDNYVFSARAVAQTRVQFSRLTPGVEATGGTSKPVVLVSIRDSFAINSGTLVAGTSTTGATDRRETRFQFQEIFSYVKGAHSMKFGGDLQRIKSTFIDLSDASGTWDFDSAGDFLANVPSRFRQNFETTSTQRNTYVGVYAQDEWRLRPNLMVSYGLRWEDESILRDLNNFGPRVAFAYDPLKSGKTVIRGGAGIFYNRALLRTIDDFTLGTQQLFFDTDALVDPVTGRLMNNAQRRAFIAANLQFPQTLTADSALVRQYGVLNAGFSRRLDPSLRIPESYQANVGFERQIGRRFVFEANYTWNRGVHLWREFNVNAPRLPNGYKNFTEYLATRDFSNFVIVPGGLRPVYNGSSPGDLVRFILTFADPTDPTNPNAIGRIIEFGVPVSVINLNSVSSTSSLNAALAALNGLRPDPSKGEVEQLIPVGNSFYHGLTLELRQRLHRAKNGAAFSFRAVYTLSRLIDDGIVNTSDALVPGAFQNERSRSLLDRRHRFALSGTFDTPRKWGQLRISPILRITSGAPFNLGLGGDDRNLDDVGNDRPNFSGDLNSLRWRRPGQPIDPSILSQFTLPTIGQSGNLPRNAGTGPGQFILDLNISRDFKLTEHIRLRPVIEFDNVLNKTVFSFGSEFIDFSAFSPTASATSRQNFIDNFLVPSRTLRPRQLRLGVRVDF